MPDLPPLSPPDGPVLVTGATGFLGATLTRALVDDGATVRVLRRPTSSLDLLGDATDAVEHVTGDVTDWSSVRTAVEEVVQVYHAAAFVGFSGNKGRDTLMAVNVEGTAHVVDAARQAGVQRLVHVSSIAALGRLPVPRGTLDETAEWRPSSANTTYAESKHLAEIEVQRAIAEGLDAVLVNPAVIFGPGRPGDNTTQIVERVRDGRFPAIPAGGTCVVDVADVVDGMRRAMAHGTTGERYILGGENLAWATILHTLADALDVDPPRRRLGPGLAYALGVANEALSAITGRRPLITRETARTASGFHRYSNRRAVEELGCSFRSFEETAARIAVALDAQLA